MGQPLPHDADLEKSVLASLLVYPETGGEILQQLSPGDFHETRNQLIFAAVHSLNTDGDPCDSTTIVMRLRESNQLEKAGGAYIASLLDHPVPSSISFYCKRLKELAERRRLIVECNATIQDARDLSKPVDDVHKQLESAATGADAARKNRVPTVESLSISEIEWDGATLTPDCIVENYLYADVGVLSAPGGTGKTTLWLWEAVHIVLGRQLYGLEVRKPGRCLLITAEDPRPVLIARLRKIAGAMGLSPSEIETIRRDILLYDVSGLDKKLVELQDGNIASAAFADEIVSGYRDDPPVLITLDPAISFGIGESKINENEQGLISAARRIRNDLGCCVRYIHHVGKQNAREKAIDQYASRGGSALPDGCRMVAVLQSWDPRDNKHRPPQELNYSPDVSVMLLARPKLSYAPANPPLIWIRRAGWAFEYFTERFVSEKEKDRARLDQVERFLRSEEKAGVRHNKNSLDAVYKNIGLTRTEMRNTVSLLIAGGRIIETDLPEEEQTKSRKTYLAIRRTSADFPKKTETEKRIPAEKPSKLSAATYRKGIGGGLSPSDPSPFLNSAAKSRRASADLADFPENELQADHWEVEL